MKITRLIITLAGLSVIIGICSNIENTDSQIKDNERNPLSAEEAISGYENNVSSQIANAFDLINNNDFEQAAVIVNSIWDDISSINNELSLQDKCSLGLIFNNLASEFDNEEYTYRQRILLKSAMEEDPKGTRDWYDQHCTGGYSMAKSLGLFDY